MPKQMIVNASAAEEIRVAIIENKKLIDLDIESQKRTKHKGNIYKGIVANVEDSLEAAFIEFGEEKQGFLPLSEVRPALYPDGPKKRPKMSEIFQRGQEVVVQIVKDEIGNKGAAVTTYLSLPGRYVVLMHSDDGGGGVSRKIDDEKARKKAREMLRAIDVPDGMAVIIRTAGMGRPRADLLRDLSALANIWEQVDRGAQLGRAPTLLYREPDLVVRTIRDYLSPSISKIVIDNEDEYEEVKSYFEERMPDSADLLVRHDEPSPVFEKYGIERAIEELFHRTVKLPSGGEIVIDQTEALVAVDVNSSRSTKEGDHEATVYKTNLETAKELARQLRLRDLGGIIVIDFIDMSSRKHERDVERTLREAMRHDKARVKIGRISENGTLELTRQRLRQAHRLVSFSQCATCEGTGVVRDPEGLAVAALRSMQSKLSKQSTEKLSGVVLRLPVPVANVLNNRKRRELIDLADHFRLDVDVIGDARMNGSESKLEEVKRGRAGLDAAQTVTDPRLAAGGRGRRGRRGRRGGEEPMKQMKTTPPPSIGPVPRVLSEDEIPDDEPEIEVQAEKAPAVSHPAHYDDPLTEALFGDAPELALEEAETDKPTPVARAKRRRRPRRRRRGGDREERAEGSEDAEASEGADQAAAEAPAAEAAAAEAPAEASADAEAAADVDAPPKKKRRTRKAKAAPAEEAKPEASSDDVEAEAKADEPAEEKEAAPKRPRKATKKAATKKATTKKAPAKAAATKKVAKPAEEKPEAEAKEPEAAEENGEKPKPKPRTRRRTKAAAAEATEPAAPAAPVAAAPESTEAQAEG
jgi:ribonuclease E